MTLFCVESLVQWIFLTLSDFVYKYYLDPVIGESTDFWLQHGQHQDL